MQLKHASSLLIAGCLVTSLALANPTYSTNQGSEAVKTDLRGSSSKLSEFDKAEARKWSLTDSDWLKYKQIMSGPRGTWSPGLDPITALGVSETDPRERKRYADIWMKVETRRIELELAFEKERMLAAKRLHGDAKAIENQAWIDEWNRKQNAVQTIVNLFVDPGCKEQCEDVAKAVLSSVSTTSKLDIYFKPGSTEGEAAEWAAHFNIDPKVVASRRITLNLKGPKLRTFKIDVNNLPQVRVEDVKTGAVTDTFGG
ncbi:TIGR03759 family integrating conjugative element protein [Zhongshania marina]|uniref:TIGR03759 family integrating conjugative element protein n=1 Tax=Zhongshania marina TaxID=2304603 RepID=A0A2S4HCA6_9GAMM|nr:TIGR03759 family integrating conjugative element protein [Marortus luteolus]POP51569.1 TIGR03759 family integrating conjugative element protein [Marortus luteolus]